MAEDLMGIQIPLLINDIFDGDDVFVHGFNLPKGKSIEEYSNSFFSEGIRKMERNSILSTVALMPHNKPLDESIADYIARGRYRVIVKIPEEINGIFLGRCKHLYGDAGNQYTTNSILDIMPLKAIPPELIVGIVYCEKEQYYPTEDINYEFIQNPYFYNHPDFKDKNSQSLTTKLLDAMDKTINNEVLKYIMTGKKIKQFDSLLDSMKKYNLLQQYEPFIEQRQQYDQSRQLQNPTPNKKLEDLLP